MKKLKLSILLLFACIGALAQTYSDVGTFTWQRAPTAFGYIYRANMGAKGFSYWYTKQQVDSLINIASSGVVSFNGRNGVVTSVVGDYSAFYGRLGSANTWTGINTFSTGIVGDNINSPTYLNTALGKFNPGGSPYPFDMWGIIKNGTYVGLETGGDNATVLWNNSVAPTYIGSGAGTLKFYGNDITDINGVKFLKKGDVPDTAYINSQGPIIGNIFKSTLTSSTGFTTTAGGSTFTFGTGGLTITGTPTNTYKSYVSYTSIPFILYTDWYSRATINVTTLGNGIGVGYNAPAFGSGFMAYINSSGYLQLKLDSNTTLATSATHLASPNGHAVKMYVMLNHRSAYATVTDVSTGQTVSVKYSIANNDGQTGLSAPGAAALMNGGGSYLVTDWSFGSTMPTNADFGILSHSVGEYAYSGASDMNTWASLFSTSMGGRRVDNFSIGGQNITGAKLGFASLVKAGIKWLIISLGINDAAQGKTGTQIYASLMDLRDSCLKYNIQPIFTTDSPYGFPAQLVARDSLLAAKAAGKLLVADTFWPLSDPSSRKDILPAYGTSSPHPNQSGHLVYAQTVIAYLDSVQMRTGGGRYINGDVITSGGYAMKSKDGSKVLPWASRNVTGSEAALDLSNVSSLAISAVNPIATINNISGITPFGFANQQTGTTVSVNGLYNPADGGSGYGGVQSYSWFYALAGNVKSFWIDPTTHKGTFINTINITPTTFTGATTYRLAGVNAAGDVIGLDIGTVTASAGAGAGTSPTVTVTISDSHSAQISVTTGTMPVANSAIFTATLTNPLDAIPVFSPANKGAANADVFITAADGTHAILNSTDVPLTASTTYIWNIKW